ncbi:MAG: hypothetical protein SNF93_00570 [Rikenellaceae bacterium]
MKRTLKYFTLLAIALSMSSCAATLRDKVSIEGYDNLEILGFSGVKVDLEFRNDSRRKIKVQEVNLALKESGSQIATLKLKDKITIPRRTESAMIPTVWRLGDVNILSAASASKKILSNQGVEAFRVDASGSAKISLFKKTYEKNNLSLSKLMKDFNLESSK